MLHLVSTDTLKSAKRAIDRAPLRVQRFFVVRDVWIAVATELHHRAVEEELTRRGFGFFKGFDPDATAG